jgi:isoleucyl-tRNA synthetase
LYIDSPDGFSRRAAQTVLSSTLLCLVRAIAPVLPHMAEDAWQNLPFKFETRGTVAETVFEGGWPEVDGDWRSFSDTDGVFWSKLLLVRFVGRLELYMYESAIEMGLFVFGVSVWVHLLSPHHSNKLGPLAQNCWCTD